MDNHFQLTYSVTGDIKAEKQKVRSDISQSKRYKHLESVETTLVGKIPLSAIPNAQSEMMKKIKKKVKARDTIVDFIETILNNNEANNTTVSCSLMVDSLGEHMEFEVSI